MPDFTLTAPPPSVNGMFANSAANGRIKTAKYRAWIKGEMNALVAQRARPVPYPVSVSIELPATIRGDVDNRIKAVNDLLVRAGIIPNDSKLFVHSVTVARGTGTQTIVRVETISDAPRSSPLFRECAA